MKASGLENHVFWATIVKTHGVKGEVLLKIENDFIEDLNDLQPVFIFVDAKPVPFFIDHANSRIKSQNSVYLKLDGVDSLEHAEKLLHLPVHIPGRLIKHDEQNPVQFAFLHFQLFNAENKPVGLIIDFIDIQHNPLLKISVDEKEILIPFVQEWVMEINLKNKFLKINFPEELLNLED